MSKFFNMSLMFRWIMLIIITTGLTACYSYKDQIYLQTSKNLPTYPEQKYKDYKIRVNDEVIFRLITTDETMSNLISPQNGGSQQGRSMISYRVYPDGTIDIPFVSGIHVEGLTLSEAALAVEKKMREIIPDAVIKLSLANKSFTVFGESGSGVFPIYKDKLTIFQALALSGDLTETSDRKHIRILRETDNGTKVLEFDIRPKSIIDSKYYYIYPNDIIYVQRDKGSFYKVDNYFSLLNVITFSLTLFFNVLNYTKL